MPSKRQRQPKPRSTRQTTKPEPEALELESEGSNLGSGLENVGFVVDLFLDQNRRVRLTQVLHVKSNEGEAWESWDESRLIDFFVQRAELSLPAAGPKKTQVVSSTKSIAAEPAEVVSSASDNSALSEVAVGVSGTITAAPLAGTPKVEAGIFRSHEIGIIPAHAQAHSRLLWRGESFDVQLFFGGENLFRKGYDELNYNASISAHTWGGLSTYFLTSGQGVIKSTDSAITVNIPKQNLEPGVYCVQAALTVTSQEENEPPAPVVSLTLKSGMLQVI